MGPEYAVALQEIRDKDRGNNIVFSSRVSWGCLALPAFSLVRTRMQT
jgi:hypothetical protein